MECIVNQTTHLLFGTNNNYFNQQEHKQLQKLEISILRYPTSKIFGTMVDNGSTCSLCCIARLEANINYIGYRTAIRRLKNQYMISAHRGSKCIGIATFKFPNGDSVIEFDRFIVEKSYTLLILGPKDIDRLNYRGADQIENSVKFGDGLPLKLERDLGHL